MEELTKKPPNIALLPPPGFLGHLIPFIELAKKLVLNHHCHVTLILPHDGSSLSPQTSLLRNIPSSITPLFLPSVPTDDLPRHLSPEALLPVRLLRSLPFLRDTLASLHAANTPATALVVDLFAPYAIDVAREFSIPAYIFYVIAANEMSLAMDLPALDSASESEYGDLAEPIKLPGGLALPHEDLPDSMTDRTSEIYKWMLDLSTKYFFADGIIANSFLELETAAFKYLEARGEDGVPPVYAVGPLVRSDVELDWDGFTWLNDQPRKSVLFVSFGSGGTLSKKQLGELALGLEMSGLRFIWVVRSPKDDVAAAYLDSRDEDDDPLDFLPEGFLERVKGKGLVVASWAPQVEVLGHASTGGFLTHCGWNSILESVVCGVPMVAWPLCFEHKMNAVLLTDGLKAAIRVKENGDGVVERGQIADVVKRVMEGDEGVEIRKRMMELKAAAGDALSEEGCSTKALAHVVQCWTNAKCD